MLTEDSYLSLEGENVIVNRDKNEMARFPLHTLEGILCFNYPGASPALMVHVHKGVLIYAFYASRTFSCPFNR